MSYLVFLFLVGVVLGLVAVASNPSPFFAALGLVVVAGMGCGVLIMFGGTFLSLILFLIYLGGMLVVFAYSAALAADSYPETFVSWPILITMLLYLGVIALWGGVVVEGWGDGYSELAGGYEIGLGLIDAGGVAVVYSLGGGFLVGAAWVLLLTLLVVLELTRGSDRGALRSV
uniref:NADH dehydrogenase subunit 6 n=1 Tax=Chasmodes bosquianus TaxID=521180 RepID=UPI0028D14502|nr:NADH dehydrogenase subunit 6 [Chasmodes bosquianus]WMY89887.1 NADH dehydrogenase subunit 6 [Chasmodes bosquianus]